VRENKIFCQGNPPFHLGHVHSAEADSMASNSVTITLTATLFGRENFSPEEVVFELSTDQAAEFSTSLASAVDAALKKGKQSPP